MATIHTAGSPDMLAALRRSAVRATFAPSLRNTQPWRLVLRGSALEIHADWGRWLRVLDRRGQQVLIGCGAAAFTARVGLAASGYAVVVERFPDPGLPDLVARITVPDIGSHPLTIGALDAVVERRRTSRQPFFDEPVPDDLIDVLVAAAATEGAELVAARREEQMRTVLRLTAQADALEQADPSYRAELRAWAAGDAPGHDGAPGAGRSGGAAADRAMDPGGRAWSSIGAGALADPCLLVLGCAEDTPVSWVRTGEALQRVLLEVTRRGYAVRPLTQTVEIASTKVHLREQLGLSMYPQVVLRVGRAPSTVAPRRRRLVDVLFEEATD